MRCFGGCSKNRDRIVWAMFSVCVNHLSSNTPPLNFNIRKKYSSIVFFVLLWIFVSEGWKLLSHRDIEGQSPVAAAWTSYFLCPCFNIHLRRSRVTYLQYNTATRYISFSRREKLLLTLLLLILFSPPAYTNQTCEAMWPWEDLRWGGWTCTSFPDKLVQTLRWLNKDISEILKLIARKSDEVRQVPR